MFTLKIAICDDDSSVCIVINNILEQIERENTLSFDILIFYSGESFHQYILENSMIFDIIFLDIELPGKNGIDIGNIIRNNFMNYITKIIYVSNYESYWKEAFQVHPFFSLLSLPTITK